MVASTISTFGSLMKTRYTQQRIQNLTESERPLIARLPKNTGFSGDSMKIPLIHVNPQGVAVASLAQAQTNETTLKGKHFLITTGNYFGAVEIGSKVMLASRDNPGAFLQNKTAEIDGLWTQLADNLHIHAWGNGGMALAQIATFAGGAGGTGTLSDISRIFAFEEGMKISVSQNDGSDTAHTLRAGSATVTAVNRESGIITVDDWGNITGETNNDYVFRTGDFYGNTGTEPIFGIQAYCPASSVSVPNLFGMVRTSDPTRLAGCRLASADYTNRNNEDRIKFLIARMTGAFKSQLPTDGFMHPEDWQALEISLNGRGQRSLTDDRTKFGFEVLEVKAGGASVRIYADRACPKGTFWATRMENWTLWSMTELFHAVEGDGLTMLRKSTTNDYEFRLEGFPQLVTNNPLNTGRVPLQ